MRDISESQRQFALLGGIFAAALVVSLIMGWILFPSLAYARKAQPINYNPPLHVEQIGITCDTCHFFYEDGSWAGIPTLETCVDCHSDIIGASPEEEKFVNEYVKKNREVKWALYVKQPECVSFSHSSHVRMAKIACETCHGPQGHSDPKDYLANRITNYSYVVYDPRVPLNAFTIIRDKGETVWGTMRMDECTACHRSRGTSTACFICHK
ncbi:MAG: cytochrome C [Candidatus Abyssobacteria bacterium SURF_17]|uniref:Cytochrome C n=1 Tax=Candidatus Abyssobacteria bacterium SURF_17 TaxID=2093361 RepID=A0A419EPJ5_9BACT|nr:MAG: cytochrome C [Candidatus Abyssubacteria bacterium SURF_17]